MELPANPKNLLHGVYNKYGQNITEITSEEPEDKYPIYALSDEEDLKDKYEAPFDMVDYSYN